MLFTECGDGEFEADAVEGVGEEAAVLTAERYALESIAVDSKEVCSVSCGGSSMRYASAIHNHKGR